jgi:hypothetical protein
MDDHNSTSQGTPNRGARIIAIVAVILISLAILGYILSRSIYESRLHLDATSKYPPALKAAADGFAEDHFEITFYLYSQGGSHVTAVIRDTKSNRKKEVRGTGSWVWQTLEPDADGVYGHYRLTFGQQSDEYCCIMMSDVLRLCNEVHPNTPPSDER